VDPNEIIGSFTGGLAVFMIFIMPIAAIVGTLIVIGVGIRSRHRERMRMIEQGILPPPPRQRKGNYYALLITGVIFLAFGIGMTLLGLIGHDDQYEPGIIFGSTGLGMVVCFIVIRRLNRDRREAGTGQSPDRLPPA